METLQKEVAALHKAVQMLILDSNTDTQQEYVVKLEEEVSSYFFFVFL